MKGYFHRSHSYWADSADEAPLGGAGGNQRFHGLEPLQEDPSVVGRNPRIAASTSSKEEA